MTHDNQYSETSTEMRFAVGVGTVAAAANLSGALYRLPGMETFNTIILWRAGAEFLMWAGGAYVLALVVVTVAPGLPALLLRKAEEATGLDLDGKPNLPTGQPKREPRRMEAQPVIRQPLEVEVLQIEDDADPFEDEELPQWIVNTDKMVWGDRLNIDGHVMDIPQGFNVEWLYTVAENRWNGKLATISTVALHSIGIERFGNGNTPASMVLAIFEEAGIITRAGERQPYTWTDAGNRVFPCPSDNEKQDG
jgi:hypothetical protein